MDEIKAGQIWKRRIDSIGGDELIQIIGLFKDDDTWLNYKNTKGIYCTMPVCDLRRHYRLLFDVVEV